MKTNHYGLVQLANSQNAMGRVNVWMHVLELTVIQLHEVPTTLALFYKKKVIVGNITQYIMSKRENVLSKD